MEKILIVEDADTLREVLIEVLKRQGYIVDSAKTAEEASLFIEAQQYSLILSDFKLPQKNGIDLLRETRTRNITSPFIIMTAFGSIDIAVEAMKLGANDFISKPFEPEALVSIVKDVIDHKRIVNRALPRNRRERSLLTEDPSMQRLMTQARKVARVDTSVLVLGESGTGKELLARYIHDHSNRANETFIAVNCAAIPPDLLESEFFGHEAGAFTGATQTRIGVFELAAEGTLFLDEIGDMPLSLQVKLLRALQEREIKRVGGNKQIKAAPRIIAATNIKIEEALNQGKIREDFYYRIAVVTFTIPPLRERGQDIDLLTRHFIEYFCNSIGKEALEVEKEAQAVLRCYQWPGNARELENVIERAVILAEDKIKAQHLGVSVRSELDAIIQSASSLIDVATQAAQRAEIDLIQRTLEQTAGNKSKAAVILGVSYKTLLNKVKEYNIAGMAK